MSSAPRREKMNEEESKVWEGIVNAIAEFYRMNGRFKHEDGYIIMQFPAKLDPLEFGPEVPLPLPKYPQ